MRAALADAHINVVAAEGLIPAIGVRVFKGLGMLVDTTLAFLVGLEMIGPPCSFALAQAATLHVFHMLFVMK